MKKIVREKYPEKTSINLLVKEQDEGNTKLTLIIFGVFIICLIIFCKFFVIDKISEALEAKQEYEIMQSEITDLKNANKDYDAVREKYSHYGNGYLNDEELTTADRKEVMNLIETNIMSKASVKSIDISGNAATVTTEGTKLSVVSSIVSSLEDSSLVSYVTVSTAGTEEDANGVTATIVVYLQKGAI